MRDMGFWRRWWMTFREVSERILARWSALVLPATEVFIHKEAKNPPNNPQTVVSEVFTSWNHRDGGLSLLRLKEVIWIPSKAQYIIYHRR